jgi:hypothetical protein
LQAAVADWLADASLVQRVPDFITLAEGKLNRTIVHPSMEQRSTATVATTSDEPEFISLPTDFQSMRRIRLNDVEGKPEIAFLSEVQLNETRTNIVNVAGRPAFYTIFGDEFELVPTPDDDYELELVYRKNITALSTSNTTNWLLTLAPDVYLYGSLLQAAPYMEDNDKLPIWSAAYQSALDELNTHGTRLKFGGSPLQIRVSRSQIVP